MSQSLLQPFALAVPLTALMSAVPIPSPSAVLSTDYLAVRSLYLVGQQADGIFSPESRKAIKFGRTNYSLLSNDNLGTPA